MERYGQKFYLEVRDHSLLAAGHHWSHGGSSSRLTIHECSGSLGCREVDLPNLSQFGQQWHYRDTIPHKTFTDEKKALTADMGYPLQKLKCGISTLAVYDIRLKFLASFVANSWLFHLIITQICLWWNTFFKEIFYIQILLLLLEWEP